MTTQSKKFVIAMYSATDYKAFVEADLSALGIRPETQKQKFASYPRYLQVDMEAPGEEKFIELVVDDIRDMQVTSIYVVIKRLNSGTPVQNQQPPAAQRKEPAATKAEKKEAPSAKEAPEPPKAEKKEAPKIKETPAPEPATKEEAVTSKPVEKKEPEPAKEEPEPAKEEPAQKSAHQRRTRISETKEDLLARIEQLKLERDEDLKENLNLKAQLDEARKGSTQRDEELYAKGIGRLMLFYAKYPDASLKEGIGLIISERLFIPFL